MTTDIIVGFPGETEDDFQGTVDLVNTVKYDAAYIFKYSARPGTPAYEMDDDVTPETKTRRFLELQEHQRGIQKARLRRYVGQVLKVLVEKPAARFDHQVSGHSTCHKVVNFEGPANLIGQIVDVRVTEVKSNSLFGQHMSPGLPLS